MEKLKAVTIYTDGACLGNPGRGGYAALIIADGQRRELKGGFKDTTNNRMEMIAAITALETLGEKCRVELYSDSSYLVNAVTKGWAKRWQKMGWRRNKNEAARNPDLWERLLKVCERHEVAFRWVRGHNTSAENLRCDRLANETAKASGWPRDEGYRRPPAKLRLF
ncbi:MAG: ribonuclease HI [Dehalococcoidia bacterium]|jgi:ribonuclease HI|nr:MAG: ribonuclease HI [Dehalococcoidia bacterium]